ncbi:MAG: hypothetical protein ACOYME_03535 [Prochlorotrichaceae cyanobacterium]
MPNTSPLSKAIEGLGRLSRFVLISRNPSGSFLRFLQSVLDLWFGAIARTLGQGGKN